MRVFMNGALKCTLIEETMELYTPRGDFKMNPGITAQQVVDELLSCGYKEVKLPEPVEVTLIKEGVE